MFDEVHAGQMGSHKNPEIKRKIQTRLEDTIAVAAPVPVQDTTAVSVKKKKKKRKSDGFTWITIQPKDLPSRGKLYPDMVIKYRPFTYGEVSDNSSIENDELESLSLLESGIRIRGGYTIEDLTLGDFFWINLLRKLSTFGTPELLVTVTDEGKEYKHKISLSTLAFADIDEQVDFPITVDMFGEEIEFTPLTYGRHRVLLSKGYDLSKPMYAIAAQQTTLPIKRMIRYIKQKATVDDLTILKAVELLMFHAPKPVQVPLKERISNPEFDAADPEKSKLLPYIEEIRRTVTVDLSDPLAIVSPFRESSKSITDRIRFGNSRSSEADRDQRD